MKYLRNFPPLGTVHVPLIVRPLQAPTHTLTVITLTEPQVYWGEVKCEYLRGINRYKLIYRKIF